MSLSIRPAPTPAHPTPNLRPRRTSGGKKFRLTLSERDVRRIQLLLDGDGSIQGQDDGLWDAFNTLADDIDTETI